jgi:hypothetical protein
VQVRKGEAQRGSGLGRQADARRVEGTVDYRGAGGDALGGVCGAQILVDVGSARARGVTVVCRSARS